MNYIIDNLKSFILKFKKYKCDNVPVRINSRWWYVDGKLHRTDGSAVEYNKTKQFEWYENGVLHRLDGPAVQFDNGHKEWYKEGKLHRLDGPARVDYIGDYEWFMDGKRHRLDGPALCIAPCKDFPGGIKHWLQNGKFHRLDGPAIENSDGTQEWYYKGNKIHCSSTEEFIRIVNLKVFW